jgi:hypothetical protein
MTVTLLALTGVRVPVSKKDVVMALRATQKNAMMAIATTTMVAPSIVCSKSAAMEEPIRVRPVMITT